VLKVRPQHVFSLQCICALFSSLFSPSSFLGVAHACLNPKHAAFANKSLQMLKKELPFSRKKMGGSGARPGPLLTFSSHSFPFAKAVDHPIAWKIQPYAPITVAPGDTVTFNWSGNHGVALIPTGDCPPSFSNNPAVKILGPTGPQGSPYVWNAKDTGVFWVACPVSDHCSEGQKIQITVA
jgi:hypothetical protein